MPTLHVEHTEIINAPPAVVYNILSDYEVGHPAILPKQYFKALVLEKGGQGSGTEFRVDMNVFGAKRSYDMVVSEPNVGEIIVETDKITGLATYFKIEPVADGQKSAVTIASEMPLSQGVAGWLEKLMNPPITKRIYKQELAILNDYAQQQVAEKA